MTTPCVRVPREAGEAARSALDQASLLDRSYEIEATADGLYIPVTDPDEAVQIIEELDGNTGETVDIDGRATERDLPERETPDPPADRLPFDPTYERLGDLILLAEPRERAERAASEFLNADFPVRSVLNRGSEIQGTERVRDWDVVAVDGDADLVGDTETGDRDPGRPPTETIHREYGYTYGVDVARAFFTPRLATERRRVVEQVEPDEHAIDMFAGVGPFSVPMADAGATVLAADVNADAIALLRDNAARNDVAERITAVQSDAQDLVPEHADTADRIVMNLPHSADEFLETAVTLARDGSTIHYYAFGPADNPFEQSEGAIDGAADDAGLTVSILDRRVIRSYAPGRVNVALDARLTEE